MYDFYNPYQQFNQPMQRPQQPVQQPTTNKIAEADKVNDLILDVDEEIKRLTRKMLEYKSVDYDMAYILMQQDEMHEEYRKKTKEIGIDIC